MTYQVSGFVNNDTSSILSGSPSLTTAATASSGVGSYGITVAQGTLAATNYDFLAADLVGGTLTVTPAPLTVTANPQTKVYGAALPALTYQVNGFVNGDTSSILSGSPTFTTVASAPAASVRMASAPRRARSRPTPTTTSPRPTSWATR